MFSSRLFISFHPRFSRYLPRRFRKWKSSKNGLKKALNFCYPEYSFHEAHCSFDTEKTLLLNPLCNECSEALVFKNVESMHQIPCGDGTSCGNSYIYSLQRLEKAGLPYEARQVERIVKRNAKEFNKEAKLAHCSRSDVTKASIPVTTKSHINDVCCKCSRNRFAKLCACVFFQ